MTLLVTAASKHGATLEIAEAIARVLAEQGVSAELVPIDEVSNLGRYDAVVLGSAVYMGKWLEPARTFIERHGNALAERKTWLFSSGPIVGDPPRPDPADEAAGQRALESAHAREHRLFAGKLDKSKLGLLEKTAVRAAHASEGDFRDWGEINRWAAEIAAQVKAEAYEGS
ncbi:MAG TPA: flavodoxin domain-containing protein [Gaiellaceae bacterium]|nr:flavodoxin domain-containing protein [Gaiellaceae bacterium]